MRRDAFERAIAVAQAFLGCAFDDKLLMRGDGIDLDDGFGEQLVSAFDALAVARDQQLEEFRAVLFVADGAHPHGHFVQAEKLRRPHAPMAARDVAIARDEQRLLDAVLANQTHQIEDAGNGDGPVNVLILRCGSNLANRPNVYLASSVRRRLVAG